METGDEAEDVVGRCGRIECRGGMIWTWIWQMERLDVKQHVCVTEGRILERPGDPYVEEKGAPLTPGDDHCSRPIHRYMLVGKPHARCIEPHSMNYRFCPSCSFAARRRIISKAETKIAHLLAIPT